MLEEDREQVEGVSRDGDEDHPGPTGEDRNIQPFSSLNPLESERLSELVRRDWGHGESECSRSSESFIVDRYPFQVDCATYSAGCSIGLVDPTSVGSREFVGNIEPVTFKNTESERPNPLHMTISPGSPYADGQVVTVSENPPL